MSSPPEKLEELAWAIMQATAPKAAEEVGIDVLMTDPWFADYAQDVREAARSALKTIVARHEARHPQPPIRPHLRLVTA